MLPTEAINRIRVLSERGMGSKAIAKSTVELGRGRGISNLDKKARITRPAPLI